jgi:sugar lactone lactonase YvrE
MLMSHACARFLRTLAVRGALAAVLMVHGFLPAQAQERVLVPWKTITGAQLVARAESGGDLLPGESQGYVPFIFPSSVAARGSELYVADSGARKIFRLDTAQQVMVAVAGMDAVPGTRLQAGPDQTLFVLDAGSSTVLNISRSGQLLESLSDPQAAANLGEFAVEEISGQIIASDRRSGRLLVIDPPGWVSRTLPAGGEGRAASLGALASRGGNIYAVDRNCSCVVVMDADGRELERVGEGTLAQPHALAVDHFGRIFVADTSSHTLNVYRDGERVASYEARKLQVREFSALAFDEGILYAADGPGGQVVAFHVRTPRKSGKGAGGNAEDR